MTHHHIGLLMIGLLFLGAFVMLWIKENFKMAISVFGITSIIVGWAIIAAYELTR